MTEEERVELAVVKRNVEAVCEDVGELKRDVKAMADKLDAALRDKADVTYVAAVDSRVKEVRGWLWGLAAAAIIAMFGAVVSMGLAIAQMLR